MAQPTPAPEQLVPYAALQEGLPNLLDAAKDRRPRPYEQWVRAYQALSPERKERVKLQVRPDGTVLTQLLNQLVLEQQRMHPPGSGSLYRNIHHFGVRGALDDTTASTV